MKLVSMKELLLKAQEEKRAVGAFNVSNMESIMGVLDIAHRLRTPVILQVAPIQLEAQNITYEQIVGMVSLFGKEVDIECALHLDHATDIEDCYKAIDAGFTAVMFDGSTLSYKDNKKYTKMVADYAKQYTVSVEGELGKVEGTEGEINEYHKSCLTDPDLVVDYIDSTGVDCLAIAIGNAHGFYKSEPSIRFDLLDKIHQRGKIPLVLHGGTGISKTDLQKAIQKGICKINFFTEIDRSFVNGFIEAQKKNENIYMMHAVEAGRQLMMKVIEEKVKICNEVPKEVYNE